MPEPSEKQRKRLILGSSSRYRRELLGRLMLPFDVLTADVPEQAVAGESPAAMAARLAETKARAVLSMAGSGGATAAAAAAGAGAVVIGSDQVASLDGALLRKPGSHEVALRQLLACQGREVVFHTAVTVLYDDRCLHGMDETTVRFRRLGEPELADYLHLDQPYDCAGGFRVESAGIALFEEIRSTDPTALIGLPLIWLSGALATAGCPVLKRRVSG